MRCQRLPGEGTNIQRRFNQIKKGSQKENISLRPSRITHGALDVLIHASILIFFAQRDIGIAPDFIDEPTAGILNENSRVRICVKKVLESLFSVILYLLAKCFACK